MALVISLGLTSCNLASSGVAPGGLTGGDLAATRQDLTPIGEMLLVRINHDRDVLGLPALTPSQALDQVAGLRAEDMLARDYLASNGPGDASIAAKDLMAVAGYRGRLGELIYEYVGPLDSLADASVGAWMASDAHRALLLDTTYRYDGVGVIGDGERWIVSLVFAEQGP